MKKRYLLFLLLFIAMGIQAASAQTLSQARAMYSKGEYEQAKPVFQRFVKSSPNNGNYNLWYGVCCLKTGEAETAIPYLEKAVKRRVTSGQLYLAQAYNDAYRFEEAVSTYETYIKELEKRKRSTEEAEALLAKARGNLSLIRGVEQVCVIDSFQVNKAQFLDAYHIGIESGTLSPYNAFFQTDDSLTNESTVYETELGNRIFYSRPQEGDGKLSIYTRDKIQGEWGKENILPESINKDVNANYPYVMSDGITIYFAADGAGSMGGYDIFVTRYNTDDNTYLMPENVGMPFNSPENDYMYVVDEYNNLGWFASDRYQPNDTVCVYVFIPNPTKRVYNYENTDKKQLINVARLHALRDTWTDASAVEEALKRLETVKQIQPKSAVRRPDFQFIIDDKRTYHYADDFRSPKALAIFKEYQGWQQACRQQEAKLEAMRNEYAGATQEERERMAPAIFDLEKRVRQLYDETSDAAKRARNTEIEALNP